MTSTYDMFHQENQELRARLDAMDEMLTNSPLVNDAIKDLYLKLAQVGGMVHDQDAAIAALTARVAALEAVVKPLPPPVDPPPVDNDTVHINPMPLRKSTAFNAFTTVQNTTFNTATKQIFQSCVLGGNQHMLGFGPSAPIQTVEGGPIDFAYTDKVFGYPNKADGFFGDKIVRILTTYGCPPYMRVPKQATMAPMPWGAPDLAPYAEEPPHWSQVDAYVKWVVEYVKRYEIDIIHEHNEGKGEWFGTPAAGSVLVPPGSGLPQAPGSSTNRWGMEHHTYRFNKLVKAVHAVRPQCKVIGPYCVLRTFASDTNADSSNDAFPKDLHGPWGSMDWEILRWLMYHIEHAETLDGLCLDVKTSTQDPASAAFVTLNEWEGLQKIPDTIAWLRKLAVYDPVKYGRAATVKVHFAEAYSRIAGGLNADNHPKAVAIEAYSYAKFILPYDVEGWVRWQVEGNRKDAATNSANAHSIALWHAAGSAKALTPTIAVPMWKGFKDHFPPGTNLYTADVAAIGVHAIASDDTLCLINTEAFAVGVTFKQQPLTLAPYDVRFIAR